MLFNKVCFYYSLKYYAPFSILSVVITSDENMLFSIPSFYFLFIRAPPFNLHYFSFEPKQSKIEIYRLNLFQCFMVIPLSPSIFLSFFLVSSLSTIPLSFPSLPLPMHTHHFIPPTLLLTSLHHLPLIGCGTNTSISGGAGWGSVRYVGTIRVEFIRVTCRYLPGEKFKSALCGLRCCCCR